MAVGGVPAEAPRDLASGVRGQLLGPRDLGYDAARAVFNSMIDRRPLAVLRCAAASDVVRGITFARRHGLSLSVRGGGHNVAGSAVVDGALMLDLSGMKDVQVDATGGTVRADPGLTHWASSTAPRRPSGWPRRSGSSP